MKALDYIRSHGKLAEVYTNVAPNGANVHIAIQALREEIKRVKLIPEFMPVDDHYAGQLVLTKIVSERLVVDGLARSLKLKRHPVSEPVIYAVDDRNIRTLIDGHHRYVMAAAIHMKRIPAYICYPALYRQFVLDDLPDLTQAELRASPHPSEIKSPWKL